MREKYDLTFIKKKIDGEICFIVKKQIVDEYSLLQIIGFFDVEESLDFLLEINNAISGKIQNLDWCSDSIENNYDLEILYPNVIINEVLIIPLQDMKQLLEEWIDFCKSHRKNYIMIFLNNIKCFFSKKIIKK